MLSFKVAIVFCVSAALAAPAPEPNPSEDGRWNPSKYGGVGRYDRPLDEGKYIHIPNPYLHMDNPYDGGFGPYSHIDEPYVPEPSTYKIVQIPPKEIPFYKEGYYKNNGIKIIEQKHNYKKDKYDFLFETENKIRQEEKAVLKNPNSNDEGIASSGYYEYIGPDGFLYRVNYTADEKGFRPQIQRLETPYSGKVIVEKIERW